MINNLLDWVTSNNGYISDEIIIENNNFNSKIITTSPIKKDSIIIKIPHTLTIKSDHSFFNDIPMTNLTEIVGNLSINMMLANASFFKPYIDTMQDNKYFCDFPLENINYEEWVKISKEFVFMVDKLNTKLRSCYRTLLSLTSPKISRDIIKVCFYIYTIRKINKILIPIIDLFECHYMANCEYFFDGYNHNVRLLIDVEPGDNLYLKNRAKNKLKLLSNFNICDLYPYVYISFNFENVIISELKSKLLKNIHYKSFYVDTFTENGFSKNLIQILRILHLRDSDILKYNINSDYNFENPICIRNEKVVNIYIKNTLKSLIKNYNFQEEKKYNNLISAKIVEILHNQYSIITNYLENNKNN